MGTLECAVGVDVPRADTRLFIDGGRREASAGASCLSAYLFANEHSTIVRAVDKLQFGEICAKRTLGESIHAHHAGFKESGLGGAAGK